MKTFASIQHNIMVAGGEYLRKKTPWEKKEDLKKRKKLESQKKSVQTFAKLRTKRKKK